MKRHILITSLLAANLFTAGCVSTPTPPMSLSEELKYSDGKDSIIIYCTKENKRIALPQSRNIRITPDILASLRAQYGIKNVETT